MGRILIIAGLLVFSAAFARVEVQGQQVQIATPQVGVQESFYESFGTRWGFSFGGPNGGVFFDRGGGGPVRPPFGGFDGASQARFGYGLRGGNGSFSMNFSAVQGSRRSMSMSAPSLTLPNGGVGGIWDTSLRPFVTSWIPVVGSGGVLPPAYWVSPLKERLARGALESPVTAPMASQQTAAPDPGAPLRPVRESSAQHGDVSVAEIRQQQREADASGQELRRLVAQAESAERAGRRGAARIAYRQAAERAAGALKTRLVKKLESLRSSSADTSP
jgi:hypothetical protein